MRFWAPGPDTENCARFSCRPVHRATLLLPMSIRAIDLVCRQSILTVRVTLFPYGMLYATNVQSRYLNNISFGSEVNAEHAGEIFASLLLAFFFLDMEFEKFHFSKSDL